jgi:tetratricopeptide (TPR) repeat protein
MAEESKSVPSALDEITELFERHDGAEMRLARARSDAPLACALVMAALCWDQLDRRGWRAPEVLGAQARRLMALWGLRAEAVDDAEQVSAALEWAMQHPALLERDEQGSYRPVFGVAFPVGSRFWREHYYAAVASGALTPLERVIQGDDDRDTGPTDLDTAEMSYRLAVDSDDPDAAALASLRLAELAESRDQTEQAARRYADVAALRHRVASPPAVLWLARQAAQDGDMPASRALAQEVLSCGDGSLRADAWALLAGLAWQDKDTDAAVAASRRAVEAAGTWHWSYSRRLAEMLAASGELADAADVYRTLLAEPLLHGPDAGRYVQLMTEAGRSDEAVAVLEQHLVQDGPFAGDLLLALASAHAARDDLDATREALARVRAHWSATLPQVSVRADVMEASLAIAEDDDERAARLFRSLTDSDDAKRRELARPLLIATGEQFATQGRLCLIPGARPLLEYLSEAAGPETAAWAATSLAHMATVEGRSDDAEAAVRLAARHRSTDEVTVLRALLLDRAGRSSDALAYLLDTAVAGNPPTLAALLPTIAAFGMRGQWPNEKQRLRLRIAVDHALSADQGDGEGIRNRIAMEMGQVELYACLNRDRAITLWQLAAESNDPTVAAQAWLSLGLIQQRSAPITAAHALEQAMILQDTPNGARAGIELAKLAERLGDNPVLARACTRVMELTTGDDRAQAALRLGWVNRYHHPDDAEGFYNTAIAEPGVLPATIGTALARLGALYALHGNRPMAQRTWRRGKNHRDPKVAEAFATERATIGRVRRITRPTLP